MLIEQLEVWQGECKFLWSRVWLEDNILFPAHIHYQIILEKYSWIVLSGTAGLGVRAADRDNNDRNINRLEEMVRGGCHIFPMKIIKYSPPKHSVLRHYRLITAHVKPLSKSA